MKNGSWGVRVGTSIFALLLIFGFYVKYFDATAVYPGKSGDFAFYVAVVIGAIPALLAVIITPYYVVFCMIYAIVKGRAPPSLNNDNILIALLVGSTVGLFIAMQQHPPPTVNPFFR